MEKERLDEIALEVVKEREGFIWEEGSYSETGVLEYEVIDFARRFLKRIDAERGKDAVAWMSPGKERIEFSRADTVYGSHTLPLFLSPTIPEGMALVPPEKPLPDLMMASYHEAVGWNACRDAMLAAAQGERK